MKNWYTQAAAVTGSGHLRQNSPGQDRTYILCEQGVTAIALADGAGSAALSHEGAECAVQCACKVLCRQFDTLSTSASPLEMRRAVLDAVRGGIHARAETLHTSPAALACTLLAVAVRGDSYLVFHVGDGVIGYQKRGRLHIASAPQNGEFCNSTTFVTSPEALLRSRVLRGTQPQIEGFFLMSDGCEAALYQKRNHRLAPLLQRLLRRAALLNETVAQNWLQATLEQLVSRRTQDDCSLALLRRQTELRWEGMTQREQAAVLGIATQNRNRRRRQLRRYAKQYCAGNRPADPIHISEI